MLKYTIGKNQKITKNKSFQAVYCNGKSFANRYAVLYVLPRPQRDSERRVGFVAGKKVGGAVVRNRAKRLMKETYRLNQDRLISGVDLVLIGRHGLVNADYSQAAKGILDLFGRAKLWEPKQ